MASDRRSTAQSVPQIGQPFNPWRGICGFYPPDIINKRPDMKDGPKRAYERLVRFAGRDGRCWPSQDTLALELGKSKRQIQRDLDVVEGLDLILRVVVGLGRGRSTKTDFLFLWHADFESRTLPRVSSRNALSSGHTGQYEMTSGAVTSGHPCPPNSVQESDSWKSVQVDTAQLGRNDHPGTARPHANEPKESKVVSTLESEPELGAVQEALLATTGKISRTGDSLPARLLSKARDHRANVNMLCQWITDERQRKEIRSHAYFVSVIDEELPAWLARNNCGLKPAACEHGIRAPETCMTCQIDQWRHEKSEVLCKRCGDSGFAGVDFQNSLPTRYVRCGCERGTKISSQRIEHLNAGLARLTGRRQERPLGDGHSPGTDVLTAAPQTRKGINYDESEQGILESREVLLRTA